MRCSFVLGHMDEWLAKHEKFMCLCEDSHGACCKKESLTVRIIINTYCTSAVDLIPVSDREKC